MLQYKGSPLSEAEHQLLRSLPAYGPYQILKRVISSKVDEHTLACANAIADSAKFDQMSGRALDSAKMAQEWQICLNKLEEIEKQKIHNTTSLTL